MPKDEPQVVLVVEDDVEMNELQCQLLAAHGIDSVSAYNGREAVDIFARKQTDGVLLDVMLPEMDGFECCCKLLEESHNGLPIVMVSALADEDCRRRGMDSGAQAYLTKPFDPDELVDTLRRLMNQNNGSNGKNMRHS